MKKAIVQWLRRRESGSRLVALLSLSRPNSHLRRSGWFKSYLHSMPVDAHNHPIPWYTYSSIAFLAGRLTPAMSVFEYGSGNSTLWWSERVSRVISCEHDAQWYALMKHKLPPNVEYLHEDLGPDGNYANAICKYANAFDIVVIDGRDRVNCARNGVAALASSGVIVWDNSDRDEYQQGFDHLSAYGFRRLDFCGLGPINAYSWCTSIFYRDENCLGI